MELWLDSGSIAAWNTFYPMYQGVTTNPKLLIENNISSYEELFIAITASGLFTKKSIAVQILPKTITINKFQLLLKEAIDKGLNVIFKFHIDESTLPYIRICQEANYPFMITSVYTVQQLYLAEALGAKYSILLYFKNDDKKFISEAMSIKDKFNLKFIAASFRSVADLYEGTLKYNVDIATVPASILKNICGFPSTRDEINKHEQLGFNVNTTQI